MRLLSGLFGCNIAEVLLKQVSRGTVGKSVAHIVGGGVGGGVVMVILGIVKQTTGRKA